MIDEGIQFFDFTDKDVVRHSLLEGQGVPHAWPAFCLAFDVVAAGGASFSGLAWPSTTGRRDRTGLH